MSAIGVVVVALLALIDTCSVVNVTLSLSSQTSDESHGLCPLVNNSDIVSGSLHWIPHPPTSSSHVWIGGESSVATIDWIHFCGCFTGDLILSKATILSTDDTISVCSRYCSEKRFRVFYVTNGYCICDNRNSSNVITLSTSKCRGTLCNGTVGGFCGYFAQTGPVCLCKYENVSFHLPPNAKNSEHKSCDDKVHFGCEKCLSDGRFICTPRQRPKFRREDGNRKPGFHCHGTVSQHDVEIPRQIIRRRRVGYLYGVQSDNKHTNSCLAWNVTGNITITKPCDCNIRALCLYNGSFIRRVGPVGFKTGVAVTVGVIAFLLIVICVVVLKYKRKEVQMKIGKYVNSTGLGLRVQCSPESISESHHDRFACAEKSIHYHHSEYTTQVNLHNNTDMSDYNNQNPGGLLCGHIEIHNNDQEGLYDSTRGGGLVDTYDHLGQAKALQRTEQRLVGDYDTVTMVQVRYQGVKHSTKKGYLPITRKNVYLDVDG